MTVNMKIDLAKPGERGLAVGLNEFAGYSGLALTAALSGYVAAVSGLRPEPFYLGLIIVLFGILLSLFTSETGKPLQPPRHSAPHAQAMSAKEIFINTSFRDANLSTVCFAGLVTNLKDEMSWGLLPLLLVYLPGGQFRNVDGLRDFAGNGYGYGVSNPYCIRQRFRPFFLACVRTGNLSFLEGFRLCLWRAACRFSSRCLEYKMGDCGDFPFAAYFRHIACCQNERNAAKTQEILVKKSV